MSGMQRRKGQRGELEAAAIITDITGWQVRRKVRQHDNDNDLEGIPGWAPEIKRHKSATRSEIASWWRQTCRQATTLLPVLFYRQNRGSWRAVWPLAVTLSMQRAEMWSEYDWTCEGTIEAWACVAREIDAGSQKESAQ